MEKIKYVLRSDKIAETCVAKILGLGSDEKNPYEVSIQKYRSKRSTEQNNRYWMLLRVFSKETGHTVDELHSIMSAEILGLETIDSRISDKSFTSPRSTTGLSVEGFGEYMQQVEQFMAEYGIIVPGEY